MPPESETLLSRFLGKNIALLGRLTAYLGALTALLVSWVKFGGQLAGEQYWLLASIAVLPMVVILLTDTLPAWISKRRERRVLERGIQGELKDPGYFRLTPYEEQEQNRFKRADQAHLRVEGWIRRAEAPLLFLTGRSGSGKSSLLAAAVLPALRAAEPPYLIVAARSFADPLGAVAIELKKPDLLWKKPPEKQPLRELLEKACKRLKERRLLVVLDQFEEFLILHEPERQRDFQQLLQSLHTDPINGLTVLMVFRSDYLGCYGELRLPELGQNHNWMEIAPFTEAASRDFLAQSGINPSADLVDHIVREAEQLEQTKGLIRPITLNMFGVLLSRYGKRLPKGVEPGALIRGYLRAAVDAPDVRDVAPRILRPMITAHATKQPRGLEELAADVELKKGHVRGALLLLGDQGLVRPVDRRADIWEISHDFVATELEKILIRWQAGMWRRLRPWLAPAALALWAVFFFVAQRPTIASAIEALTPFGPAVQHTDNGYAVSFQRTSVEDVFSDEHLSQTAKHLARIPRLSLDLKFARIADLTPLEDMTNLQTLDLAYTEVSDLTPLAGLTSLRTLHLSNTGASDLSPLEGLTSLQSLDLWGTPFTDLRPLAGLTSLQTLDLSYTPVTDLTPLEGLKRLQSLDLTETPVTDLTPLAGLTNLRSLDLRDTQVSDLTPLEGLKRLQSLDLTEAPVTDLTPLAGLTSLQTLYLTKTPVTDLTSLVGLRSLRLLNLLVTPVADLTPLAGLTSLQWLDLRGTRVADVTPLAGLTSLQLLYLQGTQVSQEQIDALAKASSEIAIMH